MDRSKLEWMNQYVHIVDNPAEYRKSSDEEIKKEVDSFMFRVLVCSGLDWEMIKKIMKDERPN